MKKIVTIQDISCAGKCSLTVALPIISAAGVECAVIPTAVLSTHTAFKNYTFRDLTSDIQPISDHWAEQGFAFDGIYTGYLGSQQQLALVSDFFDRFGTKDNLIIVDPVMADYGKLYPGFTPEFAHEMSKLCGKADIIVPNLTEASIMLGCEYRESGYDRAYIEGILRGLRALGAKTAVLTGVSFKKGDIGVMSLDSEGGFHEYYREQIPVSYHGTGDVFASALTGALLRGFLLPGALKIAVDFTVDCILRTESDPGHAWYGVNFELSLPGYTAKVNK